MKKLAVRKDLPRLADGIFNFLLFDLTTAWGMQPARALWALAVLIVLFAPAYMIALVKPSADGIWRVWIKAVAGLRNHLLGDRDESRNRSTKW